MTPLNLPQRLNELSDGVIRPFNATREETRGPLSEIPDDMWQRLCPRRGRPLKLLD